MSSVYLSSDENDLDDAELWAVIDSAAAAHSAAKTNSRRSVIPFRQIHACVSPNSEVTPPHRIFRNPRHVLVPENDGNGSSADGEVLQYRPRKMARPGGCTGDRSISSSKQIVSFRVNPITFVGTSSSPKRAQSCIVQEMYPVVENLQIEPSRQLPNVGFDASLFGRVPSVSLFKQYQNAAMEILEKGDYTMIGGQPFIKKTGWRKISFFFNVSFEIKDKSIEFDQNRDVQRAEFVVRASMQGGRFSDGWGSCYRGEKRFTKPNHDIPSTAETRAKNKACQDLLGIGEYRPGVGNNGVR